MSFISPKSSDDRKKHEESIRNLFSFIKKHENIPDQMVGCVLLDDEVLKEFNEKVGEFPQQISSRYLVLLLRRLLYKYAAEINENDPVKEGNE